MEHAQPRMWKAHGTGNHFILIDDPEGTFTLTAEMVARLCDVRTGVGADGVIRVMQREGVWFMDYRNADGSIAEMCGNGVRVFVDHLRRRGFIDLAVGESITIDTRGGGREVTVIPAPSFDGEAESGVWYRVDMGPAVLTGVADMNVQVAGVPGTFSATRIAMPNPHAVIVLDRAETLRGAILPSVDNNEAPAPIRATYTPVPEEGVNLEMIVRVADMPVPNMSKLSDDSALACASRDGSIPQADSTLQGRSVRGHLLMRVLERGVGETASCGTGCCAAAVVATMDACSVADEGEAAPTSWIIDIPGGRVIVACAGVVERDAAGEIHLSEDTPVYLLGPATPVAEIILSSL